MSKRKKLPKAVRQQCWNQFIGEANGTAPCYCCGTAQISQANFHASHVQSLHKGGLDVVGNLRPTCANCNTSMGTTNMIEFVQRYGFKQGKICKDFHINFPSNPEPYNPPSEVKAEAKKTKSPSKPCAKCSKIVTEKTLAKYGGSLCGACYKEYLGTIPADAPEYKIPSIVKEQEDPLVKRFSNLPLAALDWIFKSALITHMQKISALAKSIRESGQFCMNAQLTTNDLVELCKLRDLAYTGLNKTQLEALVMSEIKKILA